MLRAITTIFGKVRQFLIGDDNGKLRLPTSYESERRISQNAGELLPHIIEAVKKAKVK